MAHYYLRYVILKRWVFSIDLNCWILQADRIGHGRAFQSLGPATLNIWFEIYFCCKPPFNTLFPIKTSKIVAVYLPRSLKTNVFVFALYKWTIISYTGSLLIRMPKHMVDVAVSINVPAMYICRVPFLTDISIRTIQHYMFPPSPFFFNI